MPETLDIYLIEDDDDARAALKDVLEIDNHRVREFGTATEAANDDGFCSVDVVIMDRRLPDGFAEELLFDLKSRTVAADFIIVTGYADLNAAIAALREGVSDYLIKPVDPEALRTTLKRIAGRRTVERELYRQRRFAEKLLETAEAIILVLDPTGKILRVNSYFLELTGYALDEIAGANWFDTFVPERDRDRIRTIFHETSHGLKTRGVVNAIRTKGGRECEIRWSNSTLRDTEHKTTAVLCVGLDVTDYVAAQKSALQNERLAAIGQTVTGLAHETRNALQRLQNSVDLLHDELEGQPRALADLVKIERAGQHIRNLLEEVRAYAAPIRLSRGLESIPKIWRRAWESLSLRLANRESNFVETLSDTDRDESYSAYVDARRLEQVFRNLFENALDAASGALQIALSCKVTPEGITIEVQDNGPGVPADQRTTLFDAFSTSKPTGTGLGLAICKRAVEAHGGELSLLPTETGAAFLIELPRSTPACTLD